MKEKLLDMILEALPKKSEAVRYWTNGCDILCPSEIESEIVADFIDDLLGEKVCHTGYYDPVEDYKSGEVDDSTGFYYVDFD